MTAPRHGRRIAAAIGTLSIAALTVSACSGTGDQGEGGGSDDPIVIGISLPLTGDFSEPGKGVERGYEAWRDIVNENGGLLGRQVDLNLLDDPAHAVRDVSVYVSLTAQDGVDLVFGPFSTRLVVPSARVAQE